MYKDLANCDGFCVYIRHQHVIDALYNYGMVASLQLAAVQSAVGIPSNSLKPFWNDEMDKYKQTIWHDIWKSAGQPNSGTVYYLNIKV
jgi:hypothetical protein